VIPQDLFDYGKVDSHIILINDPDVCHYLWGCSDHTPTFHYQLP